MSVNKVILVGNVGKDPEVRHFENDSAVANFPLATTERAYKTRNGQEIPERTEWHNVVVWRGLAKVVESYVKKGTQLYIEGKIRTRSYDDKEGNKRYITEVYADSLQLLGRKGDNPGGADQNIGGASSPQASVQNTASSNTTAQEETFLGNDETDDLPF
ncbi:single-stranded DNA-binding protein [Carboxylicivirga sp. M1479]|uniref:single-stranded DNA-binding protein n=1 Tax=Carboxylicivirga sp. M1479 TaxID=2594476 RepID=UPI0011778878|nr:single-stranded DNA-binding protein [Carboxylicivirga sp. M1479]TRX72167.1 single-stranded DNA-binding protein [Carboxylicivirga sp. M1479]